MWRKRYPRGEGVATDHREPASRRVGHSIRRKAVYGCEMRLLTLVEGVGP